MKTTYTNQELQTQSDILELLQSGIKHKQIEIVNTLNENIMPIRRALIALTQDGKIKKCKGSSNATNYFVDKEPAKDTAVVRPFRAYVMPQAMLDQYARAKSLRDIPSFGGD